MAWFLFIDESGHDRRASPYEVLAGIAVQDTNLWTLINDLHDAELRNFGRRYSAGNDELKGTKILKTKVFQHANLNVPIDLAKRASLAKSALDDGAHATIVQLKALGLAKLSYVEDLFNICDRFNCKAIASIVESNAPGTSLDGLRKDYAYLFERFFYFLEDRGQNEQGIVVFDELEKTKSHLLVGQTQKYFKETATGRHRARLIIPEPFFVHSDLTTGVQIADLIAYCISWGFRTPKMLKPARPELEQFAKQIAKLRFRAERSRNGNIFDIWSFAHIFDLRTNLEKLDE